MNKINFLTYNILQKPIGTNVVPNEYKSERLKLFCDEYLLSFDILALQECFDSGNIRPYNLLKHAHRAGFQYFCKDPDPPLFSKQLVNGGLMILSKHPIVDYEHVFYPYSITKDRIISKGVMWAKIQLPGTPHFLHVFNTHLHAFFSYIDIDDQVRCHVRRTQQLLILKDFVRRILNKNYKHGDLAIIVGDLNVDSVNNSFPFDDVITAFEITPEEKERLRTKNEFDFYKRVLEFNNTDFKVVHTYHEDQGHFPITYGKYTVNENGEKIPYEKVVTHESEQFDSTSLDYVLELKVTEHLKKEKEDGIRILPGSLKVEEFKVKHEVLTQISDHFGISLQIGNPIR